MTLTHPEIRVKITALQAELRRLTGSTALIVYVVEETRTRSHEEVKKAVSEKEKIEDRATKSLIPTWEVKIPE